ncbi:MAG: uroporphyrinogen-III synthase [Octadecabacter sp.]|jgi:uroporphyrinogen-III synthase
MLCFKNPIVLVTRPETDAQRFVDVLRAISGPFIAINSPAFENETLFAKIPEFNTAIFTSQAGVVHAPSGNGRPAFCVGDATANAATDAGYVSISAGGSADDLVALILRQRPDDALLHIRGEITHGDIAKRLNETGLYCQEVVAYRKVVRGPSQTAREATSEKQMIIVPLFSAQTVSILKKWSLCLDGCTVVAISGLVAGASVNLSPLNIIIADTPDFRSMSQATARLIA